jgi:hypothetical protein
MGAKSFFFVWVWRQGLVMNKLSIQQVSRDETDTYPLMVLVAFEILQGNSYLYGVDVSLQSRQLVDQSSSLKTVGAFFTPLYAISMISPKWQEAGLICCW